MRDKIESRGERWSMVTVRLPSSRLAELEERAAAEGRGFGDVLRDRVESVGVAAEEGASDGDA